MLAAARVPFALRPSLSLLLVLSLGTGCPDDPPPTGTGDGSSSTGGSSTGSTGVGPGTTTGNDTTGIESASGEGSSSSGAMADSTDGDTTGSTGGSGSSESTGEPADVGCADGEREALVDDVMYPDIAACSGGWSIPGVLGGTAFCDNEAGDDSATPNGKGCAIDDLCAPDWHLCESAQDVSDHGMADCGAKGLEWDGSFFATRQSGQGADTCEAVGTNDVFGCGEIGHDTIDGCAPLNLSTGNLCADLMAPWDCDVADDSEAEFLVKEAPELGGALCCRD